MRKLLLGIFAHPDDEAFGPSGTLVLETRNGTELHLATLTCGEAGQNPDHVENLGDIRLAEWQAAAQLMGAATTHHLGYRDGTLSNTSLVEIQDRIVAIIRDIAASQTEHFTLELMTLDDNGITGHIDHTVASRAATYAFHKLKNEGLPLTRIRYICAPREQFPAPTTDWLFMPAGREPAEIDEVVDAREVLDTVHDIVRCHRSQRQDGEAHVTRMGDAIAINHFIVRS